LRLASILQVLAQPFTGKLALGEACAGGAVCQHFLPGQLAETSPEEVSGIINSVRERWSERPQVRLDLQQSGL
jgi:hypothetical protein